MYDVVVKRFCTYNRITVICAKTAEPIEMTFGLYIDSGGPKEACIRRGPDPPCEKAVTEERTYHVRHARRHCTMSCAKMAEPIDLPFGLWTGVGGKKHKFNGIRQVASMCHHVMTHWCGMAHWRQLANTIEPSVCGGDATLCQIALITCFRVCQGF